MEPDNGSGLKMVGDGKTHRLKRNQSILFTAPESVWYVEEGAVEIHSSRFQEEIPVGERRYLFQVNARGAVFAADPRTSPGEQSKRDFGLAATIYIGRRFK